LRMIRRLPRLLQGRPLQARFQKQLVGLESTRTFVLRLNRAYLRHVMARLPRQRASQIGELLPYRWQRA
jgi:RNase P/RNase MRP subunit POP5